jgi:GNAT superfamily N-acetyltransferase
MSGITSREIAGAFTGLEQRRRMNWVIPMAELIVRDMQAEDEMFMSTCSHVGESIEIDSRAAMRRQHFKAMRSYGAACKVALSDGEQRGFAYGVPIERASWGPIGHTLMVIPCLYVMQPKTLRGAGKALIASIERDAQHLGCKAVTITAYRNVSDADWFMPASFFESLGYAPVAARGREILLWRPFSPDAASPHFLQPHYVCEPTEGVVVVDLFWNAFCLTSAIEAQRVRDVCHEFSERGRLREFQAEGHEILLKYQLARAIYVNGQEIGWGYEAPRKGIRAAIQQALEAT